MKESEGQDGYIAIDCSVDFVVQFVGFRIKKVLLTVLMILNFADMFPMRFQEGQSCRDSSNAESGLDGSVKIDGSPCPSWQRGKSCCTVPD